MNQASFCFHLFDFILHVVDQIACCCIAELKDETG